MQQVTGDEHCMVHECIEMLTFTDLLCILQTQSSCCETKLEFVTKYCPDVLCFGTSSYNDQTKY